MYEQIENIRAFKLLDPIQVQWGDQKLNFFESTNIAQQQTTERCGTIIYLDHAAIARIRPEIYEVTHLNFSELFGNPSSLYFYGHEARVSIERARK